ncbi:TPA: MFS transporter [Enterobacter hormaechei subsp. xiangfangensis]|nr:MFS transporter [Enterobacter hormaechei]HCM9170235.1 MFS transporter [Enterobacter hormaechei subsp. xiangfangensis]
MASNVWFISLAVFWGLITIGIQLVCLPLQVHDILGFDLVTVGWVMGMQSVATLLSRPWAGRVTDRLGGKRAVTLGFVAIAVAGGLYACSSLPLNKIISLWLIVAGRLLSGTGEGLIITGGGAWAVSAAGTDKAGQAMSWIGLAMFAGLAAGATIGTQLNNGVMPLLLLLITLSGVIVIHPLAVFRQATSEQSLPLHTVLRYITRPGLVLALSSVGFSVVSSFVVLLFEIRNWADGGLAIALFGLGHVSSRLAFSSRADRLTGKGWIPAMLMAEASGLLLIALASVPLLALVGAMLVGLGFSMIYPLMIMPVLKSIPDGSQGIVIGVYDAFFDIATGMAALCGGVVANLIGMSGVFLIAGAAVVFGIVGVITESQTRIR